MLACLSDPAFATTPLGGALPMLVKGILVLYVPASPFMYMNMVGNRKSAFKKRFAPPPAPPKAPVGAEFPEDGKGGRSTSEAGKKVIAAALGGTGDAEAEAKCLAVKNWRFGYNKQIVKLARTGCAIATRGNIARHPARQHAAAAARARRPRLAHSRLGGDVAVTWR